MMDVYIPILSSFNHMPVAADWGNLRCPSDESAPIEGLTVRPGYHCTGCGHRTTSEKIAKRHSKCDGWIRQVNLQCWNPKGDGIARVYWIVASPQEPAADRPSTMQAGSQSPILEL